MSTADLVLGIAKLTTGATPRWTAPPPDLDAGRVIFFANHTSHLDLLVIMACLPPGMRRRTRPVAAVDYWSTTPARRFLAQRVFNALLIERKKVTRSSNPLVPMIEAIDAGSSLVLFPEGTRGEGGEMGEFHSGMYHIASRRPDVRLVPVYIDNANRVLPRGELLPVPLIVSVSFGEAMAVADGERKAAFLQRARAALEQLRGHTS